MNDTEAYLEKLENDFGHMLKHTDGYVCQGWRQLIWDMLDEIQALNPLVGEGDVHPVFEDIKEKFGTLRVYGYNINAEQQDIIARYQKIAAETCMTCGEKGELRVQHRWLYVACEEHGH
jgi:hypothetical protein